MNDVQLGEGFSELSVCYNGKYITKAELILYLYEIIDLKKEADGFPKLIDEHNKELNQLELLMTRRKIFMPVVEKPTGFTALSGKRKREYQQWLNTTDQREKERMRLEAEEDARIAKIKKRREKIMDEDFKMMGRMNYVGNRYKELIALNVIALQYRLDNIPELLLNYLFSGRAMTLSEAINIYHEEMHRMQMMLLSQEQLVEVKRMRREQMDMAWQQMQVLKEQRELQRQALEAAEDAKKAAQGAEFFSFLNLLTN
ncbi:MAG: hypothetical protein IJV48_00620 [Ruminococcus sp.]|nr:hypothetical protein [Ruminococcus sp.]